MSDKYFIINTIDRPYEKLVAQKIGDKFYYLDRSLKSYDGMQPCNPTPLEVFGFNILEDGAQVTFEKIKDSIAQYEDGKIRPWQGSSYFTLNIIQTKPKRDGKHIRELRKAR